MEKKMYKMGRLKKSGDPEKNDPSQRAGPGERTASLKRINEEGEENRREDGRAQDQGPLRLPDRPPIRSS
jgi:hypothetical protein